MSSDRISDLRQQIVAFRDERDWAQFHTLRKLIGSLSLEAAELLELTQWRDDDEIDALMHQPSGRQALRDECADVLMYLLLIADRADFDLAQAMRDKLVRNGERYPVELARGSREKYDRLRVRERDAGKS